MAIAHVGLRHLDFAGPAHASNSNTTRIAADPRDKNVVTLGLKPATASVVRERCAHHSRLDLLLELSDQPGMSLGFPVHGVLQALDQPLQVRDARLEDGHTIILSVDPRGSLRCV